MKANTPFGHHQQGFSLPEVLIAALLFAVSLLGLLQYHHVLLQAFQRQWQYRDAWSIAHQQLSLFDAHSQTPNYVLPLPPNWHREFKTYNQQGACLQHTVTIQTPLQQQVELSRWYCAPQH